MPERQGGWWLQTNRKVLWGLGLVLLLVLALNARPGATTAAVAPAPETTLVPTKSSAGVLYTFDLRDAFLDHASVGPAGSPGEALSGKTFEGLIADYDLILFVSTLQGIVNRDAPRLYVYHDSVDDFWLQKFQGSGEWLASFRVVPLADLAALLEAFQDDVAGTVVWDDAVPATMNVATTIAGVEDTPVIRRGSPLYERITASMPVQVDLSGRFSNKAEAYRWAVQEYLRSGRSNPLLLAYMEDGWPVVLYKRNLLTQGATSLFARDYIVQERGFVFDLSPWDDETPVDEPDQPLGQDRVVFAEILAAARSEAAQEMIAIWGFVPWWQKYSNFEGAGGGHEPVEGEWETVWLASSYGAYFTGNLGDVFGLDMANASVHRFAPFPEQVPRLAAPSPEELVETGFLQQGRVAPKTYLLYYMGDYDLPQTLYALMPELWYDEERGDLPLAWGINPQTIEIFPDILSYMVRSRSSKDYFVAANSGAGYLNPEALPWDLLESWRNHNQYYYRRLGLSITGFFLNGLGAEAPSNVVELYQSFSPDGISFNWHHLVGEWPRLQGNMPLTAFPYYGMSSQDALDDWVAQLEQGYTDYQAQHGRDGPIFISFRCVFASPSFMVELTEELQRRHPEREYEVVDPYTFFYLMRHDLGGHNERRATFLAPMLPEGMGAGDTQAVEIAVRNDGWDSWPADQMGLGFSLEEQSRAGDAPGDSGQALYLPLFKEVAPGQVYTFTFLLGAPLVPGEYVLQYDMLERPWQWFYESGNLWQEESLQVNAVLGGMEMEPPPQTAYPTPAPIEPETPTPIPTHSPTPTRSHTPTTTATLSTTEALSPTSAQLPLDMPQGWDQPPLVEQGLAGQVIWAIDRDPFGRVWFGGEQGVAALDAYEELDPDDDALTFYTPDDGLAHQWVTAIAPDAYGGVWFGTQGGGVAYLDKLGWTVYTERDGLASNWVRDIAVDPLGVVWFATSKGVSAFSGTAWQNFDRSNSPLPQNVVTSMAIDASGGRWFATEGGGISRLSADGQDWRNYTTADGLADPFVLSLARDPLADRLWAGTWRGGVSYFDPEQDRWFSYTTDNSGLSSNWVQTLAVDGQGRVWCGTYGLPGGGISVLTPSTGQWVHYGPEDGLPSDNVTVLQATRLGEMWVGTEQGAIRYLDPLLQEAGPTPTPIVTPAPTITPTAMATPTVRPEPTLPHGVRELASRGAGQPSTYLRLLGWSGAPQQQSPTPTRIPPQPETSTPTVSRQPSPSPGAGTPSATPVVSVSPTPIVSTSPTPEPSPTETPVWTPTWTATSTPPATYTPTPTQSPTSTPTTTASRTPTPTGSRTATPSPTGSQSPTPTRTGTPPTATPTHTASPSPTPSPTATPEETACIPICPWPVAPAPPEPPPPLPTQDQDLDKDYVFTTSWGEVMRVNERPSENALRIPETRGDSGRSVKVYVNADTLVWVAGIQLEISYDTSLLTAVDVNLSPRCDAMTRPGPVIDPDNGHIDLMLFSAEGESIPPGRGPILSLIFEVRELALDKEKAQVQIERAILSDVDGNEVEVPSHYIFDGYLVICSECFLHNGDVDKDGDVTILDVQRGINIVLGRHIADDEEVVALDINGDGEADVLDVIKVVNLALGREEPPPWTTPTPIVTVTPTPIFTPTPTVGTPAPSLTPTLVPTRTLTPGPTLTPTLTPTPGGPTLTPTLTPTPGGPTLTPTLTPTPTPTPTPGGPTLTPTPTPASTCQALAGVKIVGLAEVEIDHTSAFTAVVDPLDAVLPITYTWGVSPGYSFVHRGGVSDTLLFNWMLTGTYGMTVTAVNACAVPVSGTHQVQVVSQLEPQGYPPDPPRFLPSAWAQPR
ncbi:MAG: hypothetical protein JXA37_05535 [Chloroflexia bacterium]|nr:hypothetical protein [Chloroflexia bacterium]